MNRTQWHVSKSYQSVPVNGSGTPHGWVGEEILYIDMQGIVLVGLDEGPGEDTIDDDPWAIEPIG